MTMDALPPEAAKLLASAPDDFVAARKRLAQELRRARRCADASAIYALLRSSVADEDAREALARGALVNKLEVVGFSPFAEMAPAPRKRSTRKAGPSRVEQQKAKRRKHELFEELADAGSARAGGRNGGA